MSQIKIVDNIVDKDRQELIKKTLLDNNFFPWYYVKDISKRDNEYQSRPGFQHLFKKNYEIMSDWFEEVLPIVKDYPQVINARSFLQLPLNQKFIGKGVDTPHLDLTTPHTVVLYYVCDSDGDTILYNYESKDENDIPYFEDVKIQKKVTPKQGRAVIFNGLTWHTAEQPKNNLRCIINFNVK